LRVLPEEERIKIRTVPALLVMPGCSPLTLENYSKITAGMRDSCFIDPIMSSLCLLMAATGTKPCVALAERIHVLFTQGKPGPKDQP